MRRKTPIKQFRLPSFGSRMIKILTPIPLKEYELIDSGNGKRLERFGANILVRPDSNAVWKIEHTPQTWEEVQADCTKGDQTSFSWKKSKTFKDPWFVKIPYKNYKQQGSIVCSLKLGSSKNIGFFPESVGHWPWISSQLAKARHSPKVLNLFGYTGATSLFMAAHGAQVCHVDASKPSVEWAKRNQALSKLDDAPIRWIVEDCAKFIQREIKRGVQYDAIIMDPPAFGRDQKGKVFSFEKNIQELLELCVQVLRPYPLFFIFNGYSMGYSATVLKNLLQDHYPQASIEFGELHVAQEESGRTLPCSLFARFSHMK